MIWSINSRFLLREIPLARSTDLPASADRCGERGEFHTFAYAGPMFGVPCRFKPVRWSGETGLWLWISTECVASLRGENLPVGCMKSRHAAWGWV